MVCNQIAANCNAGAGELGQQCDGIEEPIVGCLPNTGTVETCTNGIAPGTFIWVLVGKTQHPATLVSIIDGDQYRIQWDVEKFGVAHKRDVKIGLDDRSRRAPLVYTPHTDIKNEKNNNQSSDKSHT